MDFESNGMLPAGFHDCTIKEFIVAFVEEFPTSQRRKPIVDALLDFCKIVFEIGIPYEFWVDGSFVTTKTNPNDVDIVIFLQIPTMNILGPQLEFFRKKYKDQLDIYFAYATSIDNKKSMTPTDYQNNVNLRNYWRGQFGFDRTDSPKGIVRISCDSLEKYLKER